MPPPTRREAPGYLHDDQLTLFGARRVIGFGTPAFDVVEINRRAANDVIIANHYSHKVYNLSYVHLGVRIDGAAVGVLQFGYALNPVSVANIVRGTRSTECLELNRMWLDDAAPRNSESRAISYALKYIRARYPTVAWIQSFADERCGRLGVVYQASNFDYCGEHRAVFWELDGVMYHNIIMTTVGPRRGATEAYLQANRSRATRHVFRQFRYVRFLKRRARRDLLLPVLPYPKPTQLVPGGSFEPPGPALSPAKSLK